MHARSLMCLPVLIALVTPSLARADPLFGWGEDALEDRFVDGDIDGEDHVVMHLGGEAATSDVHGESWLSLVGFSRQLRSGKNDVGVLLVVGLALDRLAAGSVHRVAEPPRSAPAPAPTPPPPPPPPPPTPPPRVVLTVAPALARSCVAAALRTSGLGTDDARIDALVSRARASAWLPETRMRGMRLWTDATHTTTLAATDTASLYDAVGANLVLELRLTWRLDRLLYAGDEASLERVRLERQDARTRVATRTLEVLFAWQRAAIEVTQAVPGSRDELEAQMRLAETEATLDVLTGGWFSDRAPEPSETADPP
ncbi:MAG TPA: hypothetical protein VIF15_01650 [Polyangiaceae bacterium]